MSTRWPRSARAAPRLIVVVVLPTEAFWVATAMILVGTTSRLCARRGTRRAGKIAGGCSTGILTVKQERAAHRFTGILTVKQPRLDTHAMNGSPPDLEVGYLLGL